MDEDHAIKLSTTYDGAYTDTLMFDAGAIIITNQDTGRTAHYALSEKEITELAYALIGYLK